MVSDSLPLMTDIEAIVYRWLLRRKIRFEFHSSLLGGIYQLGGAVVDFVISDRMLAWRVMGEYWHSTVPKRGSDLLQRERLASRGYIVVDLFGQDLEDPGRREEAFMKALQGQEMLR